MRTSPGLSDVYAFLPVALDDVIRIRLELEAEAHQMAPRPACAVPRLGREELSGSNWTKEASLSHGLVEAQEVADGDIGTTVGSTDRRIGRPPPRRHRRRCPRCGSAGDTA